jgi:uncharacterized membrane protein YecN with MAPEG domain
VLLRKPVPWTELGISVFTVLAAVALGHGLALLGAAPWLCWTALAVILAARLAHGWVTTQRPNPAGPVPVAARVALGIVMVGTFLGGFLR